MDDGSQKFQFDVKLRQYQALLEVAESIAAHRDLSSLLNDLVQRLQLVVKFDGVNVVLHDPEHNLMRMNVLVTPALPDIRFVNQLPIEEAPAGWVWQNQQPLLITDFGPYESRYPRAITDLRKLGIKTIYVLPLTSAGRRLGALGFGSLQEQAWSDDDREFLQQVAKLVAVAVDNAINFESACAAETESKRRLERLSLLLDVNNAVVAHLDLRELLKVISTCLRQVIPHDATILTLHDPESARLRLQALDLQMFGKVPFEEGVLISLEDTPEGHAITSRQPVLVGPVVDLTKFSSPWVRHAVDNGVRSGCAVPLISHDRTLGALSIVSLSEDAFDEADAELLGQCASQIAIAVENALNFEHARKVEQEAARERDRIRLLLEINNAVVSHLDLRELVKTISASLRDIMPHDTAGIALYEPELNQLREYANVAYKDLDAFREGETIPLEGTPAGQVFLTGQPLLIRRPNQTKYPADRYSQRPVEDSPKSACLTLLVSHGRKLGIVGVSSTQEERFSDDDLELFSQIAGQIAIAVENSLNFERARAAERELERKLEHLRLMLKITNAVVSQLDLQELIRIISSSIRKVMGSDIGGVALFDHESGQLRAFATDVPQGNPLREKGLPIPLENSPSGLAFTSGQPVFLDKPQLDRFPGDLYRRIVEDGYISGCRIPLIAQGRRLGILSVDSKRENAFSADDKELLVQIANQVAIAVDNSLNFERARKAEQEAKRQSDRLSTVLQINNAVVTQLDLRELLQVISRSLREMVHNDTTGVALYDPESNKLRVVMTDFPAQMELVEESYLVPLEGSVMGLAFTSGRPVFLDEFDLERFPSDFTKRSYEAGLRSCGNIPLIAHGHKLGALGVASKRPCAFSAEDIELLCQSANQIAIAVENALNFERTRAAEEEAKRQSERLQLMLEINNAVVSQLGLRELARVTSSRLREALHHDVTGISLYDPETNQFRAYMFDLPDNFPPIEEGTTMPLEGSVGGLAFTTGRPVFMSRPDPEAPSSEFDRRLIEGGIRSGGVVPLIAHDRKLGFLGVGSFREDAFSETDQELLCHIANQIAIAVENALAYREIETLKNKLASEKLYLEDEIRTQHNFEELIGESQTFRRILKQVETVAPTDSTVLICGETGTGKELIARAIHDLSGRRERTLVKINCAAIPTGLLESELFGHEKGAFTGAISQRAGRFELANRGTLFLDEVGDIPLELQPKLLRVLQEQEFERLGSTRTQKVDVRLIAATNCDLEQMVADKKYRSDLYYRLNVFPITIPALRQRREDIPALTRFFTQKYARRLKKQIAAIPAETMAALTSYQWPGNVRELEHFIERAVILTKGSDLEVSIAELKISEPVVTTELATLHEAEREHILRALDETNWVVGGPGGAAARLGMKRTTLQSKMQKLGISRQS
jgi:formate hydrogenlyase transcriptional activator